MRQSNILFLVISFALIYPLIALAKQPLVSENKSFIGGIIDDITDDIEDKFTPFTFKVVDESTTPKTISHTARQIKLKLRYKKKLSSKFNAIDPFTLEEALNNALNIDVRTQDEEGNVIEEGFDEDIVFELSEQKLKTKDKDFFEAQFLSNEIVIDTPQKLIFELDLIDFLEEINLKVETFSKTPEDTLKFKPITLEAVAIADPEGLSDFANAERPLDIFADQLVVLELNHPESLNSDFTNIDFSFKKNQKTKKPFVKIKKKKIPLLVERLENIPVSITSTEIANQQHLRLAVQLSLKKEKQEKFFSSEKPLQLQIPFIINTTDSTGLEVQIEGFAQSKQDSL